LKITPADACSASTSPSPVTCHQNHVIKTMSSKPCHRNHVIKPMPPKPCHQNHVIKTMSSKPCHQNHVIKPMPPKPCHPERSEGSAVVFRHFGRHHFRVGHSTTLTQGILRDGSVISLCHQSWKPRSAASRLGDHPTPTTMPCPLRIRCPQNHAPKTMPPKPCHPERSEGSAVVFGNFGRHYFRVGHSTTADLSASGLQPLPHSTTSSQLLEKTLSSALFRNGLNFEWARIDSCH
jgi:hypothetical protein